MLRTDFHCHTLYSEDSITRPASLIAAARRHRLDHIVITDHNTIQGARAAYELDPELVIIGEEIKTTGGEILAAFVSEEIPSDLSPPETIQRLKDQGAFIGVSHPFDVLRGGDWKEEQLNEILPMLDAIEIFNARSLTPGSNKRAIDYSKRHGIPGTAGSDAHSASEIGAAVVVLPEFTGREGLIKVISEGRIDGRLSPFWVHFFSRYAYIMKKVV